MIIFTVKPVLNFKEVIELVFFDKVIEMVFSHKSDYTFTNV